MANKKQSGKIYYVCDRTACANCSPECNHTNKVAHARNFTPTEIDGALIFIERAVETDATTKGEEQ